MRVAASAATAAPAPDAAPLLTAEEVSGACGLRRRRCRARAALRCRSDACNAPRRVLAGLAAALATVRALGFYCVTVALSLPLFVSMVLITPFEFAFDKYRRAALHFVNDLWAVCSTVLFYRVEVCCAAGLRVAGVAFDVRCAACRCAARRICRNTTSRRCTWQTTRATWTFIRYSTCAARSRRV